MEAAALSNPTELVDSSVRAPDFLSGPWDEAQELGRGVYGRGQFNALACANRG
jgi:hypothetical protein